MPLSFSIVISTQNQNSTLGQTLQALRYLRHPHFEVIVIKGPATEDTDESDAVLAPYLQASRLGHCNKANVLAAYNTGLAMAQGDIVCFLQGDAIPEPDWLDELEKGYTHSSIGGVGGYLLDATGVQFESRVIVSNRFGEDKHFSTIEKSKKLTALQYSNQPKNYPRLANNNASFRRHVLLQLGGFDEKCDVRFGYADISLRLIEAEYKIAYRSHARVHHINEPVKQALHNSDSLQKIACHHAYFAIKHATLQKREQGIVFVKQSLKKPLFYAFLSFKYGFSKYRTLLQAIDQGVQKGIEVAYQASSHTPSPILAHTDEFQKFPVLLCASERLHIGIVWQIYPSKERTGGITIWLHEVATGLAQLGHEVTFFTHAHGKKRVASVHFEEGTWVYRTVTRTKFSILFVLFGRLPTFPVIPQMRKRILRGIYLIYDAVMQLHHRRKLDVICSPAWGMEGLPYIAEGKIPTVISLHTSWKTWAESKSEKEKKRFYKKKKHQQFIRAEEWMYQHAPHLMANSNAIVRDTEALYGIKIDPKKITLIPHGIKDLLSDLRLKNPSSPEKSQTLPTNTPLRIMSVGRLERRKGIDILLDTLPALLTRYPLLEVHLVGDYQVDNDGVNYRECFLKQYAQAPWLDRVHFEGVVSESRLHALYQQIDIFVAPSRYESFGLIYVEAMIFGKPCIGTHAGGIPEVVKHNKNGLLVPIDNVEKLSEAISRLIEDAPLRRQLGEQGRADYEAHFTEMVMVKRIEECLRRVSGRFLRHPNLRDVSTLASSFTF